MTLQCFFTQLDLSLNWSNYLRKVCDCQPSTIYKACLYQIDLITSEKFLNNDMKIYNFSQFLLENIGAFFQTTAKKLYHFVPSGFHLLGHDLMRNKQYCCCVFHEYEIRNQYSQIKMYSESVN